MSDMWKKILRWGIAAVVVIILALLAWWYVSGLLSDNRRLSNLLTTEKDSFNLYVNKVHDTISRQNQLVITQEEAIKAGIIREQELKDNQIKLLQAYMKVSEQIKVMEGTIAEFVGKPIIITQVDGTDTSRYMKVPQRFGATDNKWYTVSGMVRKEGVQFDSISFNSVPKFIVGKQKEGNWWKRTFKPANPVVLYQNENPYATTKSMSNVITLEKKKWYQRNGFWFLTGALVSGTVIYFIAK